MLGGTLTLPLSPDEGAGTERGWLPLSGREAGGREDHSSIPHPTPNPQQPSYSLQCRPAGDAAQQLAHLPALHTVDIFLILQQRAKRGGDMLLQQLVLAERD